jgi:hypothetical protein
MHLRGCTRALRNYQRQQSKTLQDDLTKINGLAKEYERQLSQNV